MNARLSKNTRTAAIVGLVVVGMVAMSFAAVPLYQVFCQVTGFGGTTQRAAGDAATVLNRKVTVRFDATVNRELPWRFKPMQVSQTLKVGETGLALYEATNLSDEPIVGTATFNVTPAKAGLFFRKIECFCFTEQLLQPGETITMPVTYFVDPEIDEERNLKDVTEITLSYTFFRSDVAPTEVAGL